MPTQISELYEFGPFLLDVNERLLMRDGNVVPLSPKVFDTLLVLVQNSGRILVKDELMQMIWPDAFVEESNLTQNISQIRRALGDGKYIETIPRRGYRFVFQVRAVKREARDAGWTGDGAGLEVASSVNGSIPPVSAVAATSSPQLETVASAAPPAEETRPDVAARPGKNLKMLMALFSCGLLIVVVALSVALRPKGIHAINAFRRISSAKLTTSGKALRSDISRDGRYIAYTEQDGDRQSLWIKQVATMSSAQIVAPAEIVFSGVTFAPDDNFIYYVARPKDELTGRVYQIPVLGGVPKQLILRADSPVAFSPDGQSLAFVRNYPAQRERSLIVARLDGSNERKLLTRKSPEVLSLGGPSWSPDGKVIACAAGSEAGFESTAQILAVNLADGSARPIGDRKWVFIGQVAWLDDGSGIVFDAWQESSAVYGNPLWLLTYPNGEARRITGNLTSYTGVGFAAHFVVTRRIDRVSRIWVVPAGGARLDLSRATQIHSGFGDNLSEWFGLDWTPDGRLIYSSEASGNLDIWIATVDGQQQRQVTRDALADVMPVTSADGRYIVFVSNRSGHSNIWRMDFDGGNPRQLTHGTGDYSPTISPDGRWVVYSSWNGGAQSLWRVPVEGGEPVQLAHRQTSRPVLSPDGKWIAYSYRDDEGKGHVTVLPFAGGEPRVIEGMAFPEFGLIRWSADSSALTYIVTRDDVSNIWSHPIDGGEPKQLTNFTTDRIFRFAWSRDGGHLACERGFMINDMVLISDGVSE
jgi:eukaryotic-like serine/threonine-protein kinase